MLLEPHASFEKLYHRVPKIATKNVKSRVTGKDISLFSWNTMKISLKYDELPHYGREGKISPTAALHINSKVGHWYLFYKKGYVIYESPTFITWETPRIFEMESSIEIIESNFLILDHWRDKVAYPSLESKKVATEG